LHELTRRASAPQLAPGATTRRRWQISARVEALLEANRNATPRFARSGWLAAGALVSAALLVATQAPELLGVQQAPPTPIQFARLNPPAAPALAATTARRPAAAIPVKAVIARPRVVAAHLRRPARAGVAEKQLAQTAEKRTGTGYVLVGAWSLTAPDSYLVITVVFFEPPPPTALNRI
jgi:hypothetical protein